MGIIRNTTAKQMISKDCIELLRLLYSCSKEDCNVVVLSMLPYICLVVNEGSNWCEKDGKKIYKAEYDDIISNIRLKAKLFSNEKNTSYNEQKENLEYIMRESHTYFKKQASKFAPDWLIDDIGVYYVDGIAIGNTIQYAFDLSGLTRSTLELLDDKNALYEFSMLLGRILWVVFNHTKDDKEETNFEPKNVDRINMKDFNRNLTFKSSNSLVALTLVCRINFILKYLKHEHNDDSLLYLRILYITFYSLKSDCENLGVVSEGLFDKYHNQTFRNVMAHYPLYGKIEEVEINNNLLGYGLIEKYFEMSYGELVTVLEEKLEVAIVAIEIAFPEIVK